MGCKRATQIDQTQLRVNLRNLDETGRLHYFYHSPSSDLPVRDILDELGEGYKTEPHLEMNAENYCGKCMQPNIKGFLQSGEKYLFLATRCMRKESTHFRKLYVVGYLLKQHYELRRGRFYAVFGDTRLYKFDDAYPLHPPTANFRHFDRKLNHGKTIDILEYFDEKKDIFGKCLKEVRKLQKRLPLEVKRKQSKKCA